MGALALSIGLCGSAKPAIAAESYAPIGYGCVWSDEFGGEQGLGQAKAPLDSCNWTFAELVVNREEQAYTTKQCSDAAHANDWNYCVEDGRLRIQPRHEQIVCDLDHDGVSDNPVCAPSDVLGFHSVAEYSSGRLHSKNKVHFHDGYIEARIRLPQADREGPPESGLWPGLWMLGQNIREVPPAGSVSWPACGEIDILEWSTRGGQSQLDWNAIWLGNDQATNACSTWPQGGNVDCGPCDPTNADECIGVAEYGSRYASTGWQNFDHHAWHTYGLDWENTGSDLTDRMVFYVDGVKQGVVNLRSNESAFKLDMFLILNVALGGDLGGPIGITDWDDTFMDIDYVRWYQKGAANQCAAAELGKQCVDPDGVSGAGGGGSGDGAAGQAGSPTSNGGGDAAAPVGGSGSGGQDQYGAAAGGDFTAQGGATNETAGASDALGGSPEQEPDTHAQNRSTPRAGGGCACRTAGAPAQQLPWWLFGVAAVRLVRAKRRAHKALDCNKVARRQA